MKKAKKEDPAATRTGGRRTCEVGTEDPVLDVSDVVASHAVDVADQAMLMSMVYDEPAGRGGVARPRGVRAQCGTHKAYKQHLYHGETTCDKCRAANARYVAAGNARRNPPRVADEYVCGTMRGYKRHLRLKEPTCADCRAENNRYKRQREAGSGGGDGLQC